jgi:exopolysaccharide biosynthesis polyprenyl glycosylphosphotransferase
MSVAVEAIYATLDDRTRDILTRRATSGSVRRRGWLVRRALLAADLIGLAASFTVAHVIYNGGPGGSGALSGSLEILVFVLSLPLWVIAAKVYGLYDRDEERTDHSTADDFAGVFHLITVCTFLLYALSRQTRAFNPEFGKLLLFWALATLVVTLSRAAARSYCRRQISYLQNTIIVGAGEVGQNIARKLLKHPEYGVNLVGFVDANPRERMPGLKHLTLLGGPEEIPQLVDLLDVERVIVAFSSDHHEEQLDLIRNLNALDIQVDIVPRLFEVLNADVDFHTVEGLPVCSLPPLRLSRSSRLVKRAVDVLGAVVGLILLAPFFLATAVAIKIESDGPVFFRQVRMGERGRAFRIWKFRSMVTDADARKHEFAHLNKHLAPGGDPRMFKIEGDPRVTRVGGWLRRTSLDELPQLFNVLLGDMSLVGPRPLILDEMEHVRNWAVRRLDLKPGITGLWQVLGRDDIGFDEMVRLDYRYVTSWSLWRDVALLAQTLPAVVRGGADR